MIDLNNPIFVGPWSPQAEWKRALLTELGRRFNINVLVETGTCWGDTVEAVRQHFVHVYSVELSVIFYESAEKRFAGVDNVHLFFGSSGRYLDKLLEQVPAGPILFWLDAHVTGGPSADDGDQVNDELRTIAAKRPNALVLIDDVKAAGDVYFGPDARISLPVGWRAKFLHGVLITHAGNYSIPERF